MKTIVYAIQKGGQGKSTNATHLTFWGVEQGLSVLGVELEGQGNYARNLTTKAFDKDESPALSLFKGAVKQPQAIALPYPVRGSLALFTGDKRLTEVDEEPKIKADMLRTSLARFAPDYQLCVIDTPPTLGKRLKAALMVADYVVMPFVPARESVDGLGDLLDTIEEIRADSNPALQVLGLLANKINSRSKSEQDILDAIERGSSDMLLPFRIHERTSIAGAMAESRPVWRTGGGASQRLAAVEVKTACAYILKQVMKK